MKIIPDNRKASSWGMTSTKMGNREAKNTEPSCHFTGVYRPGWRATDKEDR